MSNSKSRLWKISITAMVLGLLLCVVGFVRGGAKAVMLNQSGVHLSDNTANTLKDLTLKPFQSVNIDIQNAHIDFIPSDTYGIDICYYADTLKPSYTIENDTLKVIDTKNSLIPSFNFNLGLLDQTNTIKVYLPSNVALKNVSIKDSSGDVNVSHFTAQNTDINVSFGDLEMNNIASDTVTITLGSGDGVIKDSSTKKLLYSNSFGSSTFENIISQTTQDAEISAKSGNVNIKNWTANSIIVNNSFGDITLDDINVTQLTSIIKSGDYKVHSSKIGKTDITNQFGKITAEDVTTTQLNAKCKSGDMKFTGTFGGNSIIESEFGKVDFSTSLKESQYNYDLSVKFGDIKLNGNKTAAKVKQNNGTENSITISNNSGDIDVHFQKN